MKHDAQRVAQVLDQRRDGFAGIDLLVVQAMQRGAVMLELAAIQGAEITGAEPFGTVAIFLRAALTECIEQLFFGFGAGEQIRAVALEVEARLPGPVCPHAAAGEGQVQHFAGWLARDQRLAEVTHRRAQWRGRALEHPHLEAAPGCRVGVGQAKNPGTDDQNRVGIGHSELLGWPFTARLFQSCRRNAYATRSKSGRGFSRPRRSRF